MNAFHIHKGTARFARLSSCALALSLLGCGGEPQDSQATSIVTEAEALRIGSSALRDLIAHQVGGLDKLTVPADDASIPLPPEDPSRPGRYRTTEAKRYLGKLLFHDPVRTA